MSLKQYSLAAVSAFAISEERSDEYRDIIDELAGEAASMKLAESFDGANAQSLALMRKTTDKNYKLVEVSAEDRAKMDDAVANGLKSISADYAERGITNAEEIYNAIYQ